MGEVQDSEDRDGKVLCTVVDVKREMQKILDRDTQTHFDLATMDEVIGRWCGKEQSKFYAFVSILRSDLDSYKDADNVISIAEDVVLNRVIVRTLMMIQANRLNVPGGTPNYSEVMADYKSTYEQDEAWIKSLFYPFTKPRADPTYPPSMQLEIKAIDNVTEDALPGARVYVNNEWVSTTWKDGIVSIELLNIDLAIQDAYEVKLELVGYEDSDVQEISESGTYTFRLVPE